jgi:methyl-accepting chemotaxis protein
METLNEKGKSKKRGANASGAAAPASGESASPGKNGKHASPVVVALQRALKGDLSTRVTADGLTGEGAETAKLLNALLELVSSRQAASDQMTRMATKEINRAIESLETLVKVGDLSTWTATTEDAELAPLLEGFGRVIDTLRVFVREINEAALRLSSSANQVLAASTQHESSSTEQAAAIHETTATMEELKHASAQIAENAGAVARVAEETLGAARAGRGAISEFIQAMQQIRSDGAAVADSIAKLSKRVERIGTVVEVIDEIADRSDLLALNAALEGSRAGEAGKGFSIVAAEMRRLAENVLDSTKEIKNLITEIREATAAAAGAADASKTATESGEKLGAVAAQAVEGILAGVQETSDAARVINLATQQQRTATEQVVASMAEIEDVTRQTTQASKQATGAAAELTQLASRLAELIKRFKAD